MTKDAWSRVGKPSMAGGDIAPQQRRIDRAALGVAAAGLVALALAMGIGRFAFTPLLPMMQADAGVSLADGGWLAGANYLGYLLGALTAGALSGAPQHLLRAGLAGVVVSTAAMGLSDAFSLWLAWRFLAGVGSAWVLVAATTLALGRLATMGRPQLAGGVFAGVGIGIALAGGVCLVLGALAVPSPRVWLLLAVVALLGTALVWRPLSAPAAVPTTGKPTAADRVDAKGLSLAYGLFGFGYILPATFLPAQARALIADPAVFGWVWPVFGAAAALSTIGVSRWAHSVSRRALWAGGHVLLALGVALPLLWPHLLALVAAAVCVGGTFMIITMAAMQEARAVGGADAPRLIARMTAAFALGQLLGPVCVSALAGLGFALDFALWGASAGLLGGALLLMHGWRGRANPPLMEKP